MGQNFLVCFSDDGLLQDLCSDPLGHTDCRPCSVSPHGDLKAAQLAEGWLNPRSLILSLSAYIWYLTVLSFSHRFRNVYILGERGPFCDITVIQYALGVPTSPLKALETWSAVPYLLLLRTVSGLLVCAVPVQELYITNCFDSTAVPKDGREEVVTPNFQKLLVWLKVKICQNPRLEPQLSWPYQAICQWAGPFTPGAPVVRDGHWWEQYWGPTYTVSDFHFLQKKHLIERL